MPANTSAAHRMGMGTHPAARLVSVSGSRNLATPRDVERQTEAGGFFWLDLESLDREPLGQFGRSLRLGTSAIAELEDTGQPAGMAMGARARQRPSLTASGDVIHALVSAAGGLSRRGAYLGPDRVHGAVPADRAFRAVPGAGAGTSPV